MSYREDLWAVAASQNGVVTIAEAEDAGVPAVEVRKLAARGALRSHGLGVYTHRGVPSTPLTEPAVAVALAGDGAFLHREAVFSLLGMGQFNPKRIRVGTRRRVRRALPEWVELEHRPGLPETDLIRYEGVPSTTAQRALLDLRGRMPRERWEALSREAVLYGWLTEADAESSEWADRPA
ncbi:type IV toxin-antitoxin system AbiEi family antitoxin domain-containing protein [Leucobacter sp. M11]|uniref:type IV toxin-antitoxin system AbiEi family antitoxin domain-containing protein n=1 Tax=Leucobacter sp. M11 TaxID=2993565 RepID=UPI002D80138C|nr:type IV toxin-antitoxin system AbiEi family antitoxin domain-containing protein [Leucobacter sp. M11]MEB4614660.1 type IV toxin-antitoxin system AbiEi family antitoxin domain-containing protein [Leucobacter sp. M11]